jgi:methoxymalonate biosynthesis acyl carrier protein
MKREEIILDLRKYIQERFGVPEGDPDFHGNTDLFSYGYIDSLGAAELTAFIERRFGIAFTDADWVTFPLATMEEIATFVSKRQIGGH